MKGMNIPAGQSLLLTYELVALPVAYGEMLVGRLEGGMVGDDPYGDVGFESSNTCGEEMLLWASEATRTYKKGTRSFSSVEMSPELTAKLKDADKNGTPDSVEKMTPEQLKNEYKNMNSGNSITGGKSLVRANVNPAGAVISIGLSASAERDVESVLQNLADGLACGFG
jgi:hypothetical protein